MNTNLFSSDTGFVIFQKMLWAATNALREEGMGMNHELFRPCMTVLFKTCQKLWLTKVGNEVKEGSTSENMLALTKLFSAFTIKEISADPTSEHIVKVCNDIMRMAETTLSQNNKKPLSSPTSPKKNSTTKISEVDAVDKLVENDLNPKILNNKLKTYNFTNFKNNVNSLISDEIKLSNIQKEQTLQTGTDTQKSKYSSPKNSQNVVEVLNGRSADSVGNMLTPKRKSRLSQNTKLNTAGTSPVTRSQTSAMAQTGLDSDKLAYNSSVSRDENRQSSESAINKSSKKLSAISRSTDTRKSKLVNNSSDTLPNCTKKKLSHSNSLHYTKSNSKPLLNQDSGNVGTKLYNKLDDGCEKDKENLGVVRIENDSSQKMVEVERSDSSHRLLSSVENTPQVQMLHTEPRNRTLQLYRLSNSGGEHVNNEESLCNFSVREPPELTAYWEEKEVQPEDTYESDSQSSPPSLTVQRDSETTTPLPDSIMSHWLQMSANSVNTSDKIMFDYEDTSYEIVFPTTNEDDTRASSICAPFDYPHLVDDSKSCFNSVFTMGSMSGSSSNS